MRKMTLRATLLAVSTLLTLSQVSASTLDQDLGLKEELSMVKWEVVQEEKTAPELNEFEVANANEAEDDLLSEYMYGNATEETITISNEEEDELLTAYMFGNSIEITEETVVISNEEEDELLTAYMYGNSQETEAVAEVEADDELLAYADNSEKEENIFSNAFQKISNLFN